MTKKADPLSEKPFEPFDATQLELIRADIAYLRQKEIDSGDWAKWEASQTLGEYRTPLLFTLDANHQAIPVDNAEEWARAFARSPSAASTAES